MRAKEFIIEDAILQNQFDMIEAMVDYWAEQYGVDSDTIWEDLETVSDEELLSEAAAWQKSSGKNKNGGLNKKGVASYRREHPGSKLQTAVTTKPSKLKKGSKAAKRRKSFCARMKGMKKHRAGAKTKRDPNSRINKSLRKWNCESVEQLYDVLETLREARKQGVAEGWSQKYKSSINCSHPKGFSQKAHCAGKKKHNESHDVMEMTCPDCGMCQTHGNLNEINPGAKDSNGFTKCKTGYHADGMKASPSDGKPVRNCKPNENFVNGKKPGRKGLSKRLHINTKGQSASEIERRARNATGEKKTMLHFAANMKKGHAKNES